MKKKLSIFALVSIVALVFLFVPAFAHAQATPLLSFGGSILAITPCLYPFTGYHIVLGPPKGGSFIYQVGLSFSYLNGPPRRPGQWLLGMSAPGIRCATGSTDGDWDDWLSGGLIIFHGSSM